MELEITRFISEATPRDYQASVAEIGEGAGQATWQAALDDSEEYLLIASDEIHEETVSHFDEYGAWNDLDEWPRKELNALLIQEISGQLREREDMTTEEIREAVEDGTISGNIFEGDDGKIYFYLGM